MWEEEEKGKAGIKKRSDAILIIHACLSLSLNLVLSPVLSKMKEKISLLIKNQPRKGFTLSLGGCQHCIGCTPFTKEGLLISLLLALSHVS